MADVPEGGAGRAAALLSRLPAEEAAGYSEEQRHALLDAYRAALEEFGDEERALAVARAAARGTPGDC